MTTPKMIGTMLQMSLKKGGADSQVIKALRFLLATPEELQKTAQAGQSTGQWLSDILEYRQIPTAMTPFDYITLSDATELRVQQVSNLCVVLNLRFIQVSTECPWERYHAACCLCSHS